MGNGKQKFRVKIRAAAAKSLQSCPTPGNPIDSSPPGSPVPGILQARTLEWVAIFLLQGMKVKSESEVTQLCPLLATPWTAAYQAPPSMGFSRQEYWSGVPLPSPIRWENQSQIMMRLDDLLKSSTFIHWQWDVKQEFSNCVLDLLAWQFWHELHGDKIKDRKTSEKVRKQFLIRQWLKQEY